MTGGVRDGELLITERRHKQNVHLVENACHLQSNLATKPVSLHKVHRGKESRLTEQVGPRIPNLYFQRAEFIIQRQLLKRGRALGKQNGEKRVIGPIGKRDLLQFQLEL